MNFDIEKYRPHVAQLGLTTQEEAGLLSALWGIAINFADRAFGIDPEQQCCGSPAVEAPHASPTDVELEAGSLVGEFDFVTESAKAGKV